MIDIATYVANVNAISRSAAVNMLSDAFKFIADEIKDGSEVAIPALGKFSSSCYSKRKARNMQTGEMIDIPARRVAKFKVAPILRDALRTSSIEQGDAK